MADWTGVLVSAGSRVSPHGQGLRQSGRAHLLRTAQGRTARIEAGLARCGARGHAALPRLGHMGPARPTVGQGRAWDARCQQLLHQHAAREDKAGPCARRFQRAGEALGVLLDVQGVEATHNMAERAQRLGVLWRKRSQGPWSEKGHRWVERVLAWRHTWRLRGRPTLPLLVAAVSCLCKGETPALCWPTQHESLPGLSTP